jgi:hypothetical protein
LGYDGGYQSLNTNYAEGGIGDAVINIPEIKLSGSSFFWASRIRSHVNKYMEWWNAKSDFAWDRVRNAGRYNDHGINFIGGAGDPVGLFDVGAQVLSTWKPENRYLAMGIGIVGAVALKKPGLAIKETQAEINILRHYTTEAGYKAIMESGELLPSIGKECQTWIRAIFNRFNVSRIYKKTSI